jgi:hypothetical protein
VVTVIQYPVKLDGMEYPITEGVIIGKTMWKLFLRMNE